MQKTSNNWLNLRRDEWWDAMAFAYGNFTSDIGIVVDGKK